MNTSLSASVLNPSKGIITEYSAIYGYILFHRPAEFRIVGKAPMFPETILDMVCHENRFQLYLSKKNLLLKGDGNASGNSNNAVENPRPDAFLKSLTIAPPDPGFTILENDTNQTGAVYILLILDRAGNELRLVRSVSFDRYSPTHYRAKTFDSSGSLDGDTKYSRWKTYQGISYPSAIDIQRVRENYEVQIRVLNMKMNPPNVTPDKFVLVQPPGATVRRLN
ncbi:MAG TPA: hypothetical protein VIY49_10365 [Bryobacteraceae bacterium]